MSEVFTNNAASVLASGISDSDTTVTVNAGDGADFPSPTGSDYFRVVMIKVSNGAVEIAKVLSRSTDVLDFDDVGNRGLEGTTPLALSANDIIELRPTAAFFTSLTNAEEVQDGEATYGIDSGAADAYVLTMTPTMTAYAAGQRVNFIPLNDNTGASVVTIDGIAGGPIDIKTQVGAALVGGEINTSGINTIEYNGTDFILLDQAYTANANEINTLDGFTGNTADLNKLDGFTGATADLNFIDVAAEGAAEASKAMVLDASKEITGITALTSTNVNGTTYGSGTLADGMVATTQSASDNSTKVATTAYVDTAAAAPGDGTVTRVKLSTTTVSAAGTITTNNNVFFALNAYAFFPMVHGSSAKIFMEAHNTDGASADSPRFGLRNDTGSSHTYDMDYRYIQA